MSRSARVLISVTVMVALSALLAGTVAAKPSGAGPGNKPNAKLCHKGGWESLVDADGNGFANEKECVAYAAQGGVPQPKPEGEADLTLSPGDPAGDHPLFLRTYTYDWDANDVKTTFEIKNEGNAPSDPLDLPLYGGLVFTSDPGENTCLQAGKVLAPDETCTYTFERPGCQVEEGFGVIGVNGTGSITRYILLTIRPPSCPTAADLTLSPGTPTGGQNPNTYTYDWDANDAAKTFTVENVGGTASDPLVALGGVGGGQTYLTTPDTCFEQSLAPGETCTLTIGFEDKGYGCGDRIPFGVISAAWLLPPGTLGTTYISLGIMEPCTV